jgi:hypothetical protein
MNHKVYETDEDRIIFTFSFFDNGDAVTWKEQWVEEKMRKDPVDFGNWEKFAKCLMLVSYLEIHQETSLTK